MNRLLASAALLACCFCACASARAAQNLIAGGEMEGTALDPAAYGPAPAQEMPAGWQPLVMGAPATMQIDVSEKHEGHSSVRIDAAEATRAYVRSSAAIDVAPGEAIDASAWVKVRDVPSDQGNVIMIAEFADASGKRLEVEKFNTLDLKTPGDAWRQLTGSVTVPANAARLHLRLGLSYSKGTVWWDGVTVTARQSLACRIDLPGRRLSPAMTTLPVTVMNRSGNKQPVIVKLAVNKSVTSAAGTLSGEVVQRFAIPTPALKPGNAIVEASLIEGGSDAASAGGTGKTSKPLFVDKAKAVVPPPLTLGVPSPTHWVIEDGTPVIEGIVDVAVPDEVRTGASLSVRLLDASGSLRGQWQPGGGGPQDGRREFSFKVARVPLGSYKLVATLTPARGAPMRDEQPWHVIARQHAQVLLNARGFPEAATKPIFPLGIFNGGKFSEQAAAGFTVTHAYNAARIDGLDLIAADNRALAFLNATEQHGMKMLLMVPMKLVIAGDWDGVRRRVRMFRNHPALLAWDEEEGFARGDFKPDTLKKLRAVLAEDDPNHPFMVGDSRDVIVRIPPDRANFFPADEMDLGMWWWYPFPLNDLTGDALEGEDAASGFELSPPNFLVNAKTRKPLWVGLQSYKKPGVGGRYPTPAEYRAQAYLAIVHGAKGLMWYGGSVTGGIFAAPQEGNWPALKQLVRELRDQSGLFMAPNDAAPRIEPAGAPVSAVVKRLPKRKVLIAVNRTANPLDVTVAGKRLALDPFGVHVSDD